MATAPQNVLEEEYPYVEPARAPIRPTHREAIFDLACELAGGGCPDTREIYLARLKLAQTSIIATRRALDPVLAALALPVPQGHSFEADAQREALRESGAALAAAFADSASLILAAAETELTRRVRCLESGGAQVEQQ